MRAALVRWSDSTTDDGWIYGADKISDLKCEEVVSIGWVMEHDEEHIVLALSKGVDDVSCNLRIAIPERCIKSLKMLEGL